MTLCYCTNPERHFIDMLHLHISSLYANKQAKRKKTHTYHATIAGFSQPCPILIRTTPCVLPEPPAEMLRVRKSKFVRYFTNRLGCVEYALLCQFQKFTVDMLDGRKPCSLTQHVAQIVGRKAQLICTILHCGQTVNLRFARTQVIIKQHFKTHKYVAVDAFARGEPPVVKPQAIIKRQLCPQAGNRLRQPMKLVFISLILIQDSQNLISNFATVKLQTFIIIHGNTARNH